MSTIPPVSRTTIERASFWAIALFLVGITYFGLSTPFITVLFGYLIIQALGSKLSKSWATVAFAILSILLFYLFLHFLTEAINALPTTTAKPYLLLLNSRGNKALRSPSMTRSR